ncbi:hypothetical protein [Flavobacterium sp. N1994]|uniref:hypothetical protein n=1 Tax=Flavobacterium sp. N1994 TaxID=2986827 RepID=UPI0022215E66|nr:hypothetical protein [Flavobacterium sp. N1994]
METEKNIRLRLRFYKDVEENVSVIRDKFVNYRKNLSPDFVMKIRNYHIQFTMAGEKHEYWSPHLSVELEEKEGNEKNATHIRGLFGPAQTLWTFFMFLHFIVAGVFLTFAMFAYSDYTLKKPVLTDLIIMFIMTIIWFLLYVFARQIRERGYDQMNELEAVFEKILES